MSHLNVHLFGTDFKFESRTFKETDALLASGLIDQVEIAAFGDPDALEREPLGTPTRILWRVPLVTRQRLPRNLASQLIKYVEWSWRILREYRRRPVAVIHCHSLLPLLLARLMKATTGARLVYDAHELETETNGLRGLRQKLARWMERALIRHVDATLVVSPSIQTWYETAYPGLRVELVRNVPYDPPEIKPYPWKQELGIPDTSVLFLYLGGLVEGRGIRAMLDAFARPGCAQHILFLGSGPLANDIKQVAANAPNIHLHASVPMEQVVHRAAGADVGMCLIEDICLSYRYSLPNKLFETIQAGVPVITADLPDQAALLTGHNAGWTCTVDADAIHATITAISPQDVATRRSGALALKRQLSWPAEATRLVSLYEDLLRPRPP
ncbi:MAG: glycosyltransferase [Achromobacter sp.]|nr:glycosyltransferase [Achromobacter sp.]